MKLDTYETWQVHTKKKFLCSVIYGFTLPSLFPCQHFFCIGKAQASYSRVLSLWYELHQPEGQVCTEQRHAEVICVRHPGGLAEEPKSCPQRASCLHSPEPGLPACSLSVCKVVLRGHNPFATWICHASITRTKCRHRSLRVSARARGTGGPGSTRLAGGVSRHRSHEENRRQKQTGSCQSNSSASPLPNVRGTKQGAGRQPAKVLRQPAGQIPSLITCLWSHVTRAQGHARPHTGRKKHFFHHLGPSTDAKILASNTSGGRMAEKCLLSRSVVLARLNVACIRSRCCP